MKYVSLLLLLSIGLGLYAQDYHSYISDRRFWQPELLYGYSFKPSVKETLDGSKQKLSAGQYTFGYSGNYLYVKGGDIDGVYSVNNTMPTEYGYKLALMNARDPSIQGHLKLILNQLSQVEALVFKRSRKEQEIIFHQRVMTEELRAKEAAYFTDLGEFVVEDVDSLWGKEVYPFLAKKEEQYRFQTKDSTYIQFIETYEIIDKRKPPKQPKKSKDKKKKLDEEEEELTEDEMEEAETDTLPGLLDLATLSREELIAYCEEDDKVRLKWGHAIVLHTFEPQEDGTRRRKTETFNIKDMKELTNEEARKGEEMYQIDFDLGGKKHIFVLLLEDRSISSIEMGYDTFYMRGH